jgi:hypothetical protein
LFLARDPAAGAMQTHLAAGESPQALTFTAPDNGTAIITANGEGEPLLQLYDAQRLPAASNNVGGILTAAIQKGLTYLLYVDPNGAATDVQLAIDSVRSAAEVLQNFVCWHNQAQGTDVNADGGTTPLDALLIINVLNTLAERLASADTGGMFLDVNGDGRVSALDVLYVINQLNGAATVGGEGEAGTPAAIKAPVDEVFATVSEPAGPGTGALLTAVRGQSGASGARSDPPTLLDDAYWQSGARSDSPTRARQACFSDLGDDLESLDADLEIAMAAIAGDVGAGWGGES